MAKLNKLKLLVSCNRDGLNKLNLEFSRDENDFYVRECINKWIYKSISWYVNER